MKFCGNEDNKRGKGEKERDRGGGNTLPPPLPIAMLADFIYILY